MVTFVQGFLGAGKTVLLNQLLSDPGNRRICIIENEAGAVSIDHTLLEATAKQSDAEILVLKNGCMCCSASGPGDELERTLDRVVQLIKSQREALESSIPPSANVAVMKTPFDYLIIETSGLVDPTPIIQTFFRCDSPPNRAHSSAL
jgi:G3E family GTPase